MSDVKNKEWISASLGIKPGIPRTHTKSLITNTRIVGSEKGYHVSSLVNAVPGDILDECLTLVTHTGINEVSDPILTFHGVKHTDSSNPIFEKSGVPLMVGLGNFNVYTKSTDPNVTYSFDPNFNLITIKAIKEIKIGDTLTFLSESSGDSSMKDENVKPKKKGGCGCGAKAKKKKQEAENVKSDKEVLPERRVPTEMLAKNVDPLKNLTDGSNEFKSMVDGKTLKSISVND